jgi:glycine/serine hydroxymethyltransferase
VCKITVKCGICSVNKFVLLYNSIHPNCFGIYVIHVHAVKVIVFKKTFLSSCGNVASFLLKNAKKVFAKRRKRNMRAVTGYRPHLLFSPILTAHLGFNSERSDLRFEKGVNQFLSEEIWESISLISRKR